MTPQVRSNEFCRSFGLRAPVLLAPMSGASPTQLSVAVARAGGMGACGALQMTPDGIKSWAAQFRASGETAFQINLWVPDPKPMRDAAQETELRKFLGEWGPKVATNAGDAGILDFDAQCEAVLEAAPPVVSSVMGLYPKDFVERLHRAGLSWWATVTNAVDARSAVDAGADVIVAQGAEAGGHRGSFDSLGAERELVGLMSLVPAVVNAVDVPVVAAGGIADGRTAAAALVLGASAVQIGTGFLRTSESNIHPAWKNAISQTTPESTIITRAFSGRAGRSIANSYAIAAAAGPPPAPYPVQRGLTAALRTDAIDSGDVNRMQAWAGQSAWLAQDGPAEAVVQNITKDLEQLLH